LDVPKLETIGGSLIIRSQASLDVPKLETIGGSLIINSQATLDAPKLSKINGKIYFDGEEISYKEFKIKFARAIPMKFESNSIKVYFTDMCNKHDLTLVNKIIKGFEKSAKYETVVGLTKAEIIVYYNDKNKDFLKSYFIINPKAEFIQLNDFVGKIAVKAKSMTFENKSKILLNIMEEWETTLPSKYFEDVDIFKNPSRKELRKINSLNMSKKIRALILPDGDILAWNALIIEHTTVV